MKGFILFHLNLSFSSIEEHDHKLLIDKCYWPILNLCKRIDAKINIEASGKTLLQIKKVDPKFIKYLKKYIDEKKIEFIGSGYVQLISPLCHPRINDLNLTIGNKVYKNLFGKSPKIALINEMSFSHTMVDLYLKHGFKAIVMDIDNVPISISKKMNLYNYGKISANNSSDEIKLIWSDSILFQNFQRYIHGENTLKDYRSVLDGYMSLPIQYLPVYTNDAEVFNFRPGRFTTEKKIHEDEWMKIEMLLSILKKENSIDLNLLSDITSSFDFPNKVLKKITDIANPVLVKKQAKYNINRWSITGRSDQKINLLTHNLAHYIENQERSFSEKDLKKILEFHSSDLRTHITTSRWNKFINDLKDFYYIHRIGFPKKSYKNTYKKVSIESALASKDFKNIRVLDSKYLEIKTDKVELKLNTFKGLCIEEISFKSHKDKNLVRSFPSGSFHSIQYGVDFFSGNVVCETPDKRSKATDLEKVTPIFDLDKNFLTVFAEIEMGLFVLKKEYCISLSEEKVSVRYFFKRTKKFTGSVRVGNFLFNTNQMKKIFVKSNLGSFSHELFEVNHNFDHSGAVSSLVSSTTSLPSTSGHISIFDPNGIGLSFIFDMTKSFAIPMLKFQKLDPQNFLRLIFSIKEIDDTSKPNNELYPFMVTISPS